MSYHSRLAFLLKENKLSEKDFPVQISYLRDRLHKIICETRSQPYHTNKLKVLALSAWYLTDLTVEEAELFALMLSLRIE